MSRRSSPRRLAVVACLVAVPIALAGCGGSSQEDAAATTTPTGQEAGDSSLADVVVSGAVGKAPTVQVQEPFSVTAFVRKEVVQGTGAKVARGQQVSIEYLGINGTDGRVFDSSYVRSKTSTFVLDEGSVSLPGIVKAVDGANVGSRIVVAVPPKDGYGKEGMAALGIGPDDTLIFVVDVLSTKALLTRAEGAPQPAVPGLPVVALDDDGEPTITVPSSAPPAALVVDQRIIGTGPAVGRGQKVTLHYTGVIWQGGRVFDSTWDREEPITQPVGIGKMIPGLDAALLGKNVGSQVLVVVPPSAGYGKDGNASADIKGTDTLVYVVDILDATGKVLPEPTPTPTASPSPSASRSGSATATPSRRSSPSPSPTR